MGLRWSEVQILSPRPQLRGRKQSQEKHSYLALFVLSLLPSISQLRKKVVYVFFSMELYMLSYRKLAEKGWNHENSTDSPSLDHSSAEKLWWNGERHLQSGGGTRRA